MYDLTQAEGYLIGNHTYSHIQLTKSNRETFKEELIKTNEILKEITGEEVEFVRPPYGSWDKSFEKELNNDYYDTSMTAALKAIDELQEKGYTFGTVEEIFTGIINWDGIQYL